MHKSFYLLPLVALTACATPQERCISGVTAELRTITGLINQTQGNIDRGFAVETRQEAREVNTTCRGRTESGEEVRVRCEEVIVRDVRVPVTIDIANERVKLDQLRTRQQRLLAESDAAVSQCRALYPDS